MNDDEREPWERLPDESWQAYRAFQAYRDLEGDRSIHIAYRRATGHPESIQRASGRWTAWAQRYRWTDRVAAWDAHVDEAARRAQERAAIRDAEQLAERRRVQKERELDVGDRLIGRALEMVSLPLVETSVTRDTADGTITQHITPAGWHLRDAARLAEVGAKLKRLALEMDSAETGPARELGDVIAQAFSRLAGKGPALPLDVTPLAPETNGHRPPA